NPVARTLRPLFSARVYRNHGKVSRLKYIISCVAPFSCSVKSSRLGSPATAPVFLTSAVASNSASGASALPGGSCGWQPSAIEENQRISKPTKNAFSGLISMVCPQSFYLLRGNTSCSVAASHSLTVRSQLPVASRFPSGEKATDETTSECPLRVSSSSPAPGSHSLTVRSHLPVASRFPSGENATDLTPVHS